MSFDAYHKWLGIPPEEQPPSHYRLLGIKVFEADSDVISNAADRQMAHVRAFQTGKYSAISQQILNQISAARICLLNAEKKRDYDAELQKSLAAMTPVAAVKAPPPVAPPPVPVRRLKPTFSPMMLAAVGAGGICVLGMILFLATSSGPEQVAAVDPAEPSAASSPVQAEPPKPESEPNAAQEKAKEPPPAPETSKPKASNVAPSGDSKPSQEAAKSAEEKSPLPLTPKPDDRPPAKQGDEAAAPAMSTTAEPASPVPALPADLASDAVLVLTFEKGSFVRRDGKLYVKDLSGEDNDGLVNEAKLVVGRVGSGLLFSTDQSYVECADSASLNPKQLTVCAWIRSPTRRTIIEDIVTKLEWGVGRGYVLRKTPQAKLNVEMVAGGWHTASSDTTLESQQWHHAAFTYDEKTLIVYVDGARQSSSDINHAITPCRKSLFIGGGKYENGAVFERFDGIVDEVAVFSRALTEKEIRSVHQLGLKGEHLVAPEESSPAEPDKAMPEPSPAKEGPGDPRTVLSSLKKKLRGRVAYDWKTGLFSLAYDWNSKAQLQDFDVSKAKLAHTRGRLSLQGGESIRHNVDFKEVTIEAMVLVPQMKGKLIETTGGAIFFLGGPGSDRMYLSTGRRRERIESSVPKNQRIGLQPILVTIAANRLAFAYGAGKPTQLGRAVDNFHAGQVEVLGGDVGYQFGRLVLTGTIDENWLKSNLEERPSDTATK